MVALADSGEAVVIMIALWMLGATVVPVDFRSSAGERGKIASEFDLITVIEDQQEPAASYTSVLVDASWTDLIARHDSSPMWPRGECAPAFISLTSGTTSRPVGFVLDHDRAILRFVTTSRYGGSLLSPLSPSFSGSRTHTFGALLHGATVRFHPVLFSPQELAEAIMAWKVTSVCAVPTIIRNLLELAKDRSTPLFEGLEAFYSIGAPMLAEEKLDAKIRLTENFIQEYGSTLSGPISQLLGSDLDMRPETIGRTRPLVALQVVDGNGQALPSGEVGNIRVRVPGMARTIYGTAARELRVTPSRKVGPIPEILARSTNRGSYASSAVAPTSSSAVAQTFTHRRSKPLSPNIQACVT